MIEISPRRRRVGLALYAVLTVLSFPHELPGGASIDFGLVFAWLGPAGLVVGLHGLSPWRAARIAFAASLVCHSVLFHWFAVVTVVYGGMPVGLGVLAPILPAFYVSLFTALFAWAWAWARDAFGQPVLVGAILWTAVDWARGHFLGGFPWATLGYALHLDLPLLGWTRWGGVYLLSFFAVAVAIAIATAWLDRNDASRRQLVITLVLILVAHGLGALLAAEERSDAPTVRVAAIQGNIEQGQKWDPNRRHQIFETYLRLSSEAGDEGVDWIVWPETAVPGLIEYDGELRSRIGVLARRYDAALMVGGMGIDLASDGRPSAYYDSAFHFDRGGAVRARYDKTHLVPFGEYVPLRALLGQVFQSLATGLSSTDVTAGATPRALEMTTGAGADVRVRVGVPICYELLFPHLVRKFAADGAGVLLAITNDAWYGRTGAPHQFLAMTALRSAESGRWTVRAANTGISAIIDSQGRVRQASALFEEAVVAGEIPIATDGAITFYARYGDAFAWLCVLVSAVLLAERHWAKRGRPAIDGVANGDGEARAG